ncbi:PKD domain-containing protein [Candidatus Bathyarchaeota archaeon]|nr:MAG: PKD domain-containing protein [Candidatus Bathyarchaeota archaeon]
MSIVHHLNRKSLPIFLVALSIASLILLSSTGGTYAAPTGANFDHIVTIAMENQKYADVLGDGTPAGCPSGTAPFLCGMLPLGSTIPNYHSYCIGSNDPACTGAGTLGNPPCSAACYTAITSGATYTSTDGLGKGSISATNIFDSLSSAGLSWTEFCESNCPRGPDHSPCQQYADTANSSNCITLSGALIGNSQVLGSTSNYVWITPTDGHNMHDNTVSSGDSWLKSFLVGSGSIASPASGSLLSSALFTNPSFHTLLWIWWDEYDPSPNIQYGSMISKGFISTSNNWDEYSQLRMIENNWELPTLSYDAQTPIMTDILGTGGPQTLSASFTYTPTSPVIGAVVAFTGSAAGGTAPYSYSWSFGDGTSATGASATHAFSNTGTYPVTVTVTDSNSSTSTSTQQVTVSNSITTITYLYIGLIAGGAISVGVFLAKYHSRNRRPAAELRSAG